MSGGFQDLVVNPSERAVSSDILRLQSFKGKDIAEIFRAMFDTAGATDDFDAGAVESQTTTATAPSTAEILNGFRVSPQNGSLNLFVTPGSSFILDPDAVPSTDDSPYKLLNDPGVTIAGALTMSAGGGGAIRIDVIECARVGAPIPGTTTGFAVLETDSRDIFNNTTGLFTPQTVNKVVAGRLQYRVRQGVAGAGFPGAVAGWLPLAVVSVPPAAANNDAMTFWDVRPMLSDRVLAPFNLSRFVPQLWPNHAAIDLTTAGKAILRGMVDVSLGLGTRRLGGQLLRGTPGADGFPDLLDVANQADPLAGGTGFVYVYLLEPFGLPKWARYTDAIAGNRVPRSPRGIPVVSLAVAPTASGAPSVAVALPASMGLGTSTSRGVCIAQAQIIAGAIIAGNTGFAADGKWVSAEYDSGVTGVVPGLPGTVVPPAAAAFTMTPGATSGGAVLGYPPYARALLVEVSMQMTAAAGAGGDGAVWPIIYTLFAAMAPPYSAVNQGRRSVYNASGGAKILRTGFTAVVPVPLAGALPVTGGFIMAVADAGGVIAYDTCDVRVIGWSF